MDQAELEKQRRYFWDSALTVMNGPAFQINQDVTAYPKDTLTIKHGEGDEKTYRMYSTAWMRSLDYLLYRYLILVLHDTKYSEEIKVPVEVREEYNPCIMYLDAFFRLVERGEIRLAENIKTYLPEVHDGFLADQTAWVDYNEVYAKVTRYYNRPNVTFPLKEQQLAIHLADAELIEVTYEDRNGRSRRHYSHSGIWVGKTALYGYNYGYNSPLPTFYPPKPPKKQENTQ